MCASYGKEGHQVRERTVLVGYACEAHSDYQNDQITRWSGGSKAAATATAPQSHGGYPTIHTGTTNEPQGLKITSTIALRALEEARLTEDNSDATTDKFSSANESVLETASTQTTVDNDLRLAANKSKQQGLTNHASNLADLRSRLRYPGQYVSSLQELEEIVWNSSTLSMYTTQGSGSPSHSLYKQNYGVEDYIPYPLVPSDLQDVIPNRLSDDPFAMDPTNTSDEEITSLCQTTADATASSHLNAIRMCRNVALRTFLNLKTLQRSKFCAGSFSVIVLDRKRQNVAMLVPVENTDFVAFLYELEYILRDVATLVLTLRGSEAPLDIDRRFVFLTTPMVKVFCSSLLRMDVASLPCLELGVVNVLRIMVSMLDLAVASYAGAHCSDFPDNNYQFNQAITLLEPFGNCPEELKKRSVTFQRCSFQCLDAFHHGRGVWVFCQPGFDSSLPLYLSATIEDFSDIWGPLWKLKDQDDPNKYSAYVVGSGSILQWQHDSLTCPELVQERFCHWLGNEELEDETQIKLGLASNILYTPFDGMEKLLIGAPTKASSAVATELWTVNPGCSIPISQARTQLREAGRLCIVGASKPYHYNDSNQYQLQVGYSGVNASTTRQYKRVPGQTLKEILIELWAMEPEIRDPKLLEDLHGVKISMCTRNAQRVPLTEVLCSKSVHSLLRDFNWRDPEYRTEHFLTLKDTLRPKRLLDAQFKDRFDYAVMLGLKMLNKTGVDREGNLRVFLSSTCTPKPELATMLSREHSWIGLLKDTTTECAMAAFGDECLEFKYHEGACCGRSGHSALRSALILHSSMYVSEYRKAASEESTDNAPNRTQGWAVSTLEVGKIFSLGERGRLRLKSNLGGNTGVLVMGWSSHYLKISFKGRLSRDPVHREYTEIDHSEEGKIAHTVVPIIVISDRSG